MSSTTQLPPYRRLKLLKKPPKVQYVPKPVEPPSLWVGIPSVLPLSDPSSWPLTPNLGLVEPPIGETGWGNPVNNNWIILDTAVAAAGVHANADWLATDGPAMIMNKPVDATGRLDPTQFGDPFYVVPSSVLGANVLGIGGVPLIPPSSSGQAPAMLTVQGDSQFNGSAQVTGNFVVRGFCEIDGSLSINNLSAMSGWFSSLTAQNATVNSFLDVAGNLEVDGLLNATSSAQISGNLTVGAPTLFVDTANNIVEIGYPSPLIDPANDMAAALAIGGNSWGGSEVVFAPVVTSGSRFYIELDFGYYDASDLSRLRSGLTFVSIGTAGNPTTNEFAIYDYYGGFFDYKSGTSVLGLGKQFYTGYATTYPLTIDMGGSYPKGVDIWCPTEMHDRLLADSYIDMPYQDDASPQYSISMGSLADSSYAPLYFQGKSQGVSLSYGCIQYSVGQYFRMTNNVGTPVLRFGSDGSIDLMTAPRAPSGASIIFNNAIHIDGSGNIGINNLSPSYTLDVVGSGHFSGNLTVDGQTWLNSWVAFGNGIAGNLYISGNVTLSGLTAYWAVVQTSLEVDGSTQLAAPVGIGRPPVTGQALAVNGGVVITGATSISNLSTSNGLSTVSNGVVSWNGDTGISRVSGSPGWVQIGNGNINNASGGLLASQGHFTGNVEIDGTLSGVTASMVGAEPALGNPPVNGYVLSSTTAGVRSWVAPASGGGGPIAPPVDLGGFYPTTWTLKTGNLLLQPYSSGTSFIGHNAYIVSGVGWESLDNTVGGFAIQLGGGTASGGSEAARCFFFPKPVGGGSPFAMEINEYGEVSLGSTGIYPSPPFMTVKGNAVGIGTSTPTHALEVTNGGTGKFTVNPGWFSGNTAVGLLLSTDGPSYLGGDDGSIWLAYAKSPGNWCIGANAGDVIYRNQNKNLWFTTTNDTTPSMLIAPSSMTMYLPVNFQQGPINLPGGGSITVFNYAGATATWFNTGQNQAASYQCGNDEWGWAHDAGNFSAFMLPGDSIHIKPSGTRRFFGWDYTYPTLAMDQYNMTFCGKNGSGWGFQIGSDGNNYSIDYGHIAGKTPGNGFSLTMGPPDDSYGDVAYMHTMSAVESGLNFWGVKVSLGGQKTHFINVWNGQNTGGTNVSWDLALGNYPVGFSGGWQTDAYTAMRIRPGTPKDRITLDPNGCVGIGKSQGTAGYALDVNGHIMTDSTHGVYTGFVSLTSWGGTTPAWDLSQVNLSSGLGFYISNDVLHQPAITVEPANNYVGIGISQDGSTTPTAPLNVAGVNPCITLCANFNTATNTPYMTVGVNGGYGAGSYAYINTFQNYVGPIPLILQYPNSVNTTYGFGKVGIGVATPRAMLEVGPLGSQDIAFMAGSALIQPVGASQAIFGDNLYYSGGWQLVDSGHPGSVMLMQNTGNIQFVHSTAAPQTIAWSLQLNLDGTAHFASDVWVAGTLHGGNITPAGIGAEPALGNPPVSGYVLASSTSGVRAWVAPATGGGGGGTPGGIPGQVQYNLAGGFGGAPLAVVTNGMLFDALGSVSTSTPFCVSFGGTYGSGAPGSAANLKWKLWDDGTPADCFGIGMSAGLMEFNSSGGGMGWFVGGGIKAMGISQTGVTTIGSSSHKFIIDQNGNVSGGDIGCYGIYNTAANNMYIQAYPGYGINFFNGGSPNTVLGGFDTSGNFTALNWLKGGGVSCTSNWNRGTTWGAGLFTSSGATRVIIDSTATGPNAGIEFDSNGTPLASISGYYNSSSDYGITCYDELAHRGLLWLSGADQSAHFYADVYIPGTLHGGGVEPALGNPSASGYILSSTSAGVRSWIPAPSGGSGSVAWGAITGTLSAQTDLQTALNAKANTSSLATVATSGSYTDLTNKPILAVTKAAVSGQPLLSYDSTTGNYTQGALTAAQVGALPSTTIIPLTKAPVSGQPLLSYDATTGSFTQGALTAAQVGALPSGTILPVTKAAVAGQPLLSYDSTTGNFTQGALTAAQVGALPSSTVLPANTAATASQWFTAYNSATGAFTKAQPAFTDISGVAAAAQLPAPTTTTLGGVKSLAAVATKYLTSIDTTGTPIAAQPVWTDIAGNSNPGTNGYVLASTTAGVKSWVAPAATQAAVAGQPLLSYNAATGAFTQGSLTASQVGAEPTLSNPSTSGYALVSTSAGVRSWAALPATIAAVAGQPLLSYNAATGAWTQGALTAAQVGALPSTTVLPANTPAVANNFMTAYNSATGAFTLAQPSFANLSGVIAVSQMTVMVGDTGSGGVKGDVPAPAAGDAAANRFLKADGTWATPPGGGSGSPGGSSGQFQINSAGAFAGSPLSYATPTGVDQVIFNSPAGYPSLTFSLASSLKFDIFVNALSTAGPSFGIWNEQTSTGPLTIRGDNNNLGINVGWVAPIAQLEVCQTSGSSQNLTAWTNSSHAVLASISSTGAASFPALTVAGQGVEPALGNPSANGMVLSSTTAGVRSWIAAGGGSTTGPTMRVLTASGTYSKPTGVVAIIVEVIGGGGGAWGGVGGGSASAQGSGAGAGAYARKVYNASSTPAIASSYNYTIGAGGTAGASGNNAGGAGGSSIWDSGGTPVTAPGGSTGTNTGSGSSIIFAAGGAGGALPTGGDINIPGQPGGFALRQSGSIGVSGAGGSTVYGSGGISGVAQGAGQAGSGYGSGGAGACSLGGTGAAGGAGAPGVIVVWEFRA